MFRPSLYAIKMCSIMTLLLLLLLVSCGKDDGKAKNAQGDPLLTDNLPNMPPEAPPEIPTPQPDTAIQSLKRELAKIQKPAEVLTPAEPAPILPAFVPPPPPPPPPATENVSDLLKTLPIEDLLRRADNANQGANTAQQKTLAAASLAERTQKQAEAKNCPATESVKKEVKNANIAVDKTEGQQKNIEASVKKTKSLLNSLSSMQTSREIKTAYENASRSLSEAETNASKTTNYAREAEEAAARAVSAIENCKEPVKTNTDDIKHNIAQDMMDLSRDRRNTRLQTAIRNYFDDSNRKGVITTESNKSYSVEQYITKLNTEGAHHIKIETISIDDDGRVRGLSLIETKLAK